MNGERVFKYPFSSDWAVITLVNGQDVNVLLPELHVEVRLGDEALDPQLTDVP